MNLGHKVTRNHACDMHGLKGLAIVMPILNEAETLARYLQPLQALRREGALLVIVDGGSDDNSAAIATKLTDKVIEAPRGRAKQMNAGVQAALNDASLNALLLLHCDTLLPADFASLYQAFLSADKPWGFFPVRLDANGLGYRLIGWMISWRSRMSRIATGDQGFLITPEFWLSQGGLRDMPLMEDLEFSYRCKKQRAMPWLGTQPVVTSARRWQTKGLVRTVLLMWFLRAAFYLGMDAKYLAKLYR